MTSARWIAVAALLFAPGGVADLAAQQRPADDRPRHDDAALAAIGIHRYASRRLVLYSDIDPAVARTLPALLDAAYPAWEAYFGPLPPAADGSEFQLTGYLMRDRGLFLDAGLLPEDLVEFEHGRHRGYRFWMAEQKYDYYRRHLLIHEGTHCFMMIQPVLTRPPLYYLEGMAELFGTHELQADGSVTFRVMPQDPHTAVGFGRIEMIQQMRRERRAKSLEETLNLSDRDFTRSKSEPYAWSWALCKFLDTHPRYRDRFRQLAAIQDGAEYRREFARLFTPDAARLAAEWDLFVATLAYGYDLERGATEFRPGMPLATGSRVEIDIDAARGWQSTGLRVARGEVYRLSANGEITLADDPRPWVSRADGVTIRYAGGYPIGRLLGAILQEDATDGLPAAGLTQVLDVGENATLRPDADGTLYLRVNDAWSSLADNRGSFRVDLRLAP